MRVTGTLTDRNRLRGFDALHLASALSLGAGTTLICWDKDLARATRDEGMSTIPDWR
ncbi:MAG TPA: hypothetical protein VGP33_05580 [Chloroflexota bacterium]|nr:hypothetical protein [Chloroflexota bacterium]